MRISSIQKAGLLLATITLCSATFAADTKARHAGAKDAGSQLAGADRKFMEKAAEGGMAEVEMGKLGQQNGSRDDVKKFGERMVQDHSKANDELKQLASSKGVTLPTELDSKHRHDHDKLAKLSGDKFDREYMEHMVKDHKKDVKEFDKASKDSKDADLKAFASKTLSVIQGHLMLAENTESAVKGKGRTAGAMSKDSGAAAGSTKVSGNTANISGNAPASGDTRKPTSTPAGTASR
jgi:putative membrane protein